mmetsp:Transcript_7292/g.21585  ORF Transcript_7292/g.21585 Transcript_7292/m.21585 type:complete len:264 (-) Transcript_7292:1602-2393(-)
MTLGHSLSRWRYCISFPFPTMSQKSSSYLSISSSLESSPRTSARIRPSIHSSGARPLLFSGLSARRQHRAMLGYFPVIERRSCSLVLSDSFFLAFSEREVCSILSCTVSSSLVGATRMDSSLAAQAFSLSFLRLLTKAVTAFSSFFSSLKKRRAFEVTKPSPLASRCTRIRAGSPVNFTSLQMSAIFSTSILTPIFLFRAGASASMAVRMRPRLPPQQALKSLHSSMASGAMSFSRTEDVGFRPSSSHSLEMLAVKPTFAQAT